MRLVDADALKAIRFHDLPYSQIVPADCDTDEKVSAYKLGWNDAIDAIVESVPTVDHIKHGHWIITPYTDYDDTYECSVCGEAWTFIEGTPKDNEAYYCPKCGARMDETPNIPRHNGKSMMELERLIGEVEDV